MKKMYLTPEFETLEFEIEAPLLSDSDITGGGISDDNSVPEDNTPSTDPTSDFGW